VPWSSFLVCQQLLPGGGGGFEFENELIIPAPPPPLLFYFQTWSACKERRRRRNHGLKPHLGGDNKPIHDLSFPQLPQVATSEKHHHQNIKRSKQRTQHSSIPLFLTTRFCSSVAPRPRPRPRLLYLCVSVSVSKQQISAKLCFQNSLSTDKQPPSSSSPASSPTKPEALVVD